ncbi:hypothetical protein N474_22365 [Pseudoalteromonas luteoviolacea CPMOR-2]|uniref:Uncharacterized protein n=1 Tax=Pseudoalteromonas luteoviolacea DSM 6061 TaxID=1365250 RepID=A0A161XVR7_9GAMM|nr:hypothetical protein N475_17025 [Pseudoalteromonas luteoviolacea DSM 6061]KZN52821.1 hypothetical protein N474_22365 [Pseudoalteromonas luteoviolacea CPMOR-2]
MTTYVIGVNTDQQHNEHTQKYAHYSIINSGIQQPRYLSVHLRPEALRPSLSKGLLF